MSPTRPRRTETRLTRRSHLSGVYVFVNAAMSADGKLSTRRREQVRISGPDDFARVDRLRADADAILVGV